MNNITLLIISVFFLIILMTPILGLIRVTQDVIQSRKIGKELRESRELGTGIIDYLQLLRDNDIPEFKAAFSNWLEGFINLNSSGWVQMNPRFILEAQAIALGESSRDKLQYHDGYRTKIIRRTYSLATAIITGNLENLMRTTGDLMGLVLSSHALKFPTEETINSVQLVATTMKDCSRLITKDVIESENIVRDALLRIAERGEIETLGIPVMVLKWSQISIKDISGRSFRRSITFNRALKEVSSEFSKAASLIKARKIHNLAKLVYGIN